RHFVDTLCRFGHLVARPKRSCDTKLPVELVPILALLVCSLMKRLIVLAEFDQSTMANMTAALEFVCRRIPKEKDTHDVRKRIADAMISRAKSGNRDYVDFQSAGMKALDEILRAPKFKRLWSAWVSRLPGR